MSNDFPCCARVILAQAPFLELRLELRLASTTVSLIGLALGEETDSCLPSMEPKLLGHFVSDLREAHIIPHI